MGISDFSLYPFTLRLLIVQSLGYQPYIVRPPKFIYIPCVNMLPLSTPTTPHTPDYLTLFSTLSMSFFVCAVTDFATSGRLISRISVTKPVCSRLRIAACLLAYRELEYKPRDSYPPTKISPFATARKVN